MNYLKNETLQCFSWFFLQFISFFLNKISTYYDVVKNFIIQKMFFKCSQLKIQNIEQKIKHIFNTITNFEYLNGVSSNGRYDNDFLNIK